MGMRDEGCRIVGEGIETSLDVFGCLYIHSPTLRHEYRVLLFNVTYMQPEPLNLSYEIRSDQLPTAWSQRGPEVRLDVSAEHFIHTRS
jgi:hypothetical protein